MRFSDERVGTLRFSPQCAYLNVAIPAEEAHDEPHERYKESQAPDPASLLPQEKHEGPHALLDPDEAYGCWYE